MFNWLLFCLIKETAIKNNQKHLDSPTKSSKPNADLFLETNKIHEHNLIDKKESKKSKKGTKSTNKSVAAAETTNKIPTEKPRQTLYKAELKIIGNTQVNRATSINGTDLNYIQLNTYSYTFKHF